MIDGDFKITGIFIGGDTSGDAKWEDINPELDPNKFDDIEPDCKFFPAKTADEVYQLVTVALATLFVLAYSVRFLTRFIPSKIGSLFGFTETARMMTDLICETAEGMAEIWNGGGTEECTETEHRPGFKSICIEHETED